MHDSVLYMYMQLSSPPPSLSLSLSLSSSPPPSLLSLPPCLLERWEEVYMYNTEKLSGR